MSEPVLNLSERDRAQSLRDGLHQGFKRASLGRPQNRLDFRPAQFNWVEVWRIRRQEFQACALGFNQLPNGFSSMGRQVIHHYDVTPAQGREQLRANIGCKGNAIDGAFKDPRGGEFLAPQRGNEGVMGGPNNRAWLPPPAGPAPPSQSAKGTVSQQQPPASPKQP